VRKFSKFWENMIWVKKVTKVCQTLRKKKNVLKFRVQRDSEGVLIEKIEWESVLSYAKGN